MSIFGMKFINILDFDKEVENIALAKKDIGYEGTLSDFIKNLGLENSIMYISDKDLFLPFAFFVGVNDKYCFYSGNAEDKDLKYLSLHQNLDELKKVDMQALFLSGEFKPSNDYFFIINKEYYV